jgi:hypothetical protein
MVIVVIRALGLEYLVKILDWGRSRYIFTESVHFYRLRLHLKFLPTPRLRLQLHSPDQHALRQKAVFHGGTAHGTLGYKWLVDHRLKGVGVYKKHMYSVQKIFEGKLVY